VYIQYIHCTYIYLGPQSAAFKKQAFVDLCTMRVVCQRRSVTMNVLDIWHQTGSFSGHSMGLQQWVLFVYRKSAFFPM
jgi:hypothetical protein